MFIKESVKIIYLPVGQLFTSQAQGARVWSLHVYNWLPSKFLNCPQYKFSAEPSLTDIDR